MDSSGISVKTIEDARNRISPEFLDSRQFEHDGLSAAVGARLVCKIESENPVGSFKGRGADCFVSSLPATSQALITASAGNFGLALSYAARRRGVATTVYAAETACITKIDRIRRLGADVKLLGRDFDEAKAHAREAAERMNLMFVEDGHEATLAAGAGTMTMEITQLPQLIHSILVPLGNGALLSGIGHWFRSRSPRTRIIGVCAEGAPSMALSWRSGRVQTTASVNTIADGIAVRIPVPEALEDLQDVVDDIVLVKDDAIKYALHLTYKTLKLVCEPAGVVGIAALVSHSSLAKGLVCSPITCGNATLAQFRNGSKKSNRLLDRFPLEL
jgi:threonine dehydratase